MLDRDGYFHIKNECAHICSMKQEKNKPPTKKGRGKRVENKEKTKQAILRAALDLFAEKGFGRTTTKAISRKAGIAEGTLFNYFETKEDLALYFLEQELDEVIEWYQQDPRIKSAELAEKLFAIIQHLLDRLTPYKDFIGAVYLRAMVSTSKLSPWSLETQERKLRYLRFIQGILAEAEASGEIPRVGDFGAHAFGLFHLAVLTHWLQDRSPGKEKTLALLDRCLKLATHFLQKGGWEW